MRPRAGSGIGTPGWSGARWDSAVATLAIVATLDTGAGIGTLSGTLSLPQPVTAAHTTSAPVAPYVRRSLVVRQATKACYFSACGRARRANDSRERRSTRPR